MEWLHTAVYPLILGLLVLSTFVARYQKKKKREYQNDERWKSVVAKGEEITFSYFRIFLSAMIIVLLALGWFGVTTIPLWYVYTLLIGLTLIGDVIGFFALRYYDKHM